MHHVESLTQIDMAIDDIKALRKAILSADDPVREMEIRCDNITERLQLHLDTAGYNKPKK